MTKLTVLSFLLSISFYALAQDPLLTQKTGNLNHFNPALVGVQSDFGVQLNYRNQWPKLTGNSELVSVLTNYNFSDDLGVGLELKSNVYGIWSTSNLKANVNYHKIFGNVETRYGISLGLGQQFYDLDRFRFEEQISPVTGFVNPTSELYEHSHIRYFILDMGVASYYKGFLLGAGTQQVNEPNKSLSDTETSLPIRWVGTLAYMKEFDQLNLAAMATIQHQSEFSIIETQVFGQYKCFKLGLGHHQNFGNFYNTDFVSASAGIQFDKFSIGYSHDTDPLDRDVPSLGGTHQVTAAWYIKGLKKETGMSKFLSVLM